MSTDPTPAAGRESTIDGSVADLVAGHLADADTGWSIGVYGAIAEFLRAPDEMMVRGDDPFSLVTPRGGIRITGAPDLSVRAYERPSRHPKRWVQGVLFCLPGERRIAGTSGTIAALGPDREALRQEDREAELFDLGVAGPHLSACVRSADSALVRVLRRACGRSALDDSTGVMAAILEAQPHRVFRSPAARIEVFQGIPRARGDGTVNEGPHTHLLPELLARGRVHSLPEVIPAGRVPVLEAHPPNPLLDALGRERAFDEALFEAFQRVMAAWGDPAFLAEKAAVEMAIADGHAPERLAPAPDPGRAAARVVTVRQIAQRQGQSDLLAAWRTAVETPGARAAS